MLNSYYQDRLVFKTQKIVSIDDGLRGNIYDKNGILLVGNKKVYNLTYHYNENEDILEILKFLYNNFNINKDEFLKKVNNSYKYEDIILKNNLTENEVSLVLNSDVKGLFIKESFERFYPYKDTLKNVLGSVGFIQKENKKKFPYLSGTKICNYWLYVIWQYTDRKYINMEDLTVAPDTHVVQATYKLGLINEEEFTRSDVQLIVIERWNELLKDTKYKPIDIHTPLWLWSRNGFIDIG